MPKITENLPGVKTRRIGVTYVPKVANAEFPRDSEFSKYYCCKVMRAPAAINNICNNLTWRKTHPKNCGLGGDEMAPVARGVEVSQLKRHNNSASVAQLPRGLGDPVGLGEQRGGPVRRLGGGEKARAVRGARVNRVQGQSNSAPAVQMLRGLGWSVQRMKVPTVLFIFCWAMQFKAAAAVTIENHSDYQECIQNGCSFLDLRAYIGCCRVNNLTGTLPTQMGELTNLTSLKLDWNRLTGTVPTQMAALTRLMYLQVGGNSLTGTVPTQMGALTQLDILDGWPTLEVQGHRARVVPSEVSEKPLQVCMRHGVDVYVGAVVQGVEARVCPSPCTMKGETADDGSGDMGAMQGHCWVGEGGTMMLTSGRYLNDNSLTGTLPTQMGALTRLMYLHHGMWGLAGILDDAMTGLMEGTLLRGMHVGWLLGYYHGGGGGAGRYLNDNSLTGTLPTQMGALTRLMYLYLNDNSLTGTVPTQIGALTQLVNFSQSLSGVDPMAVASRVFIALAVLSRASDDARCQGAGCAALLSASVQS
ncbi:hypothetical protein CYMTET_4142 [Cymbomonas tetramitiformis]|uniref:Uncharacterized protein n=1 Tax=Cymbomonas tetramitiformis TaxID=36881 RepID=A0AAE0H1Z8_9CHLO|nr:hypothetical protein CYMTET_4142 [Cymbomonas tetramitiformis]